MHLAAELLAKIFERVTQTGATDEPMFGLAAVASSPLQAREREPMSQQLTPQDAEQRYVQAMGPELGAVFHRLSKESGWLHQKWNEYQALFRTTAERIEMLNKALDGGLNLVRQSLCDDILLHICRVTDDPRDTLSVQQLLGTVNPVIRQGVRSRIDALRARAAFARDWRNRRIGRRDLDRAPELTAVPLSETSRQRLQDAFDALDDLLSFVENHYGRNQPTGYHDRGPADAEHREEDHHV